MTRPGPARHALHYCGKRHNPKYACPPADVKLNGVRTADMAECTCPEGSNWHAENCPRRWAIFRNRGVR